MAETLGAFLRSEINQTLANFPKYWHWLHEVKLLDASRAGMGGAGGTGLGLFAKS